MSTIEQLPDCTLVKPQGNIVASAVPELRAELLSALGGGDKDLVIDMAAVKIVDSMGIAVIIAAHNTLDGKPGKLKLINVDEDVRGLLRLMRLDQHFEIS